MEDACFEIQCIRLAASLPKSAEDSDEESDFIPGPSASELISRFHDLRETHHPNLAEMLKITSLRNGQIALFVESYPRSLADLIQERKLSQTAFREEDVLQICFSVLQGVCEMHRRGIAVLTICPANVLLTPSGRFLLRNYYEGWLYGEERLFSRDWKYIAPEETTGGVEYIYKVDSWAIAMLALQCLTLASLDEYDLESEYPQLLSTYKTRPLFQTYRTNLKSKLERLLSGRDWSKGLSEDCQQFLAVALSLSPANRLDAMDLIGHPVFGGYNMSGRSGLNLEELQYWWLRFHNIASPADLEKYLIMSRVLPFTPPVLSISSVFDPTQADCISESIQFLGKKLVSLEQLIATIETIDSKLESIAPSQRDSKSETESISSATNESLMGKLASLFKAKSSKSDSSTKEKTVKKKREFLSEYLHCRKIRSYLTRDHPSDNFSVLCSSGLPSLLRPEVWRYLLGVASDYSLVYSYLSDTQISAKYSRQISIDVKRCHQYHPLMSARTGKQKLEAVLSLWLGENPEFSYIQGLDSVCAVLVLVYYQDLAAVFACFAEIVRRYLYTLCLQENSLHIHETFITFRNLLNFVDPQLGAHFRSNQITMEMFATPWVLTLYSHVLSVEKVVQIWDRLFFHPASFTTYLGIALLRLFRSSLLKLDESRIMSLLPKIADFVEIDTWLTEGEKLQNQLPPSLCSFLICPDGTTPSGERWWQIGVPLAVAQKTWAPLLDAHDLLAIIGNSLIVEVRSSEEYNQSHVAGSQLVPLNAKPSQTTIPKGTMTAIHNQSKGKTVVVVGDKRRIAHSIANDLISAEVPQVCLLRGGIDAIKADAAELLQGQSSAGLLGRLRAR